MAKRTQLQVRIRAARKAAGWTLQEAADNLGISKGHLHDIESGRHANPTLALLQSIQRVYGFCLVCND
jgi:transcriptional regulator with XRE-family HTH domain